MIKRIATVGGWTLVSRISGFIRDVVMAAVLGAGPMADAFFVAFRLPNHFRAIFAEGAFAAAFVPAYARVLQQAGIDPAKLFADRIAAALIAINLVLLSLALLFTPWVVSILAPGLVNDPTRFDLAVALTRITFPYLALVSLETLLAGVLNANQRFAAAAGAPVLLNVSLIATLLLAPYFQSAGYAAAWGVAIAGVAQVLLVAIDAEMRGIGIRFRLPKLDENTRRFLKALGPAIVGAGGVQLALFADTLIASFLPTGALSALYYADRINQLPIGVVGIAVGTVLLPEMSRRLAAGDERGAALAQARGIQLALLMAVPCVAGAIAIPDLIMRALFARGAFTAADAAAAGATLAAYAIGLLPFVMMRSFTAPFYARGDTLTPVKAALLAAAVNIALKVVLMGPLAQVGLALATSVGAWINLTLLTIFARQQGFAVSGAGLRPVIRLLLAGAVLAVALYFGSLWLSKAFAGLPYFREETTLAVLLSHRHHHLCACRAAAARSRLARLPPQGCRHGCGRSCVEDAAAARPDLGLFVAARQHPSAYSLGSDMLAKRRCRALDRTCLRPSHAGHGASGPPACGGGKIQAGGECVDKERAASEIDKIVRKIMTDNDLKAVIAGVSVAGQPVLTKAWGESMTGVPATYDMHFRNGSVAIAYLGVVTLQLQEKGVLRLDDKLSKWFPDYPKADRITLAMLLNATSGYADYVNMKVLPLYKDPFRNWQPDELIALSFKQPMVCEPGTCFAYAHTNFVILGKVLEKATGRGVAELIRDGILVPLSLNDTRSEQTAVIQEPVLHAFDAERGIYEDATYWDPSWTLARGAVMTSNVADILKSVDAIGTGALLSPDSFKLQLAPTTAKLKPWSEQRFYGLGIFVIDGWLVQNPSFAGYAATMAYLPAQKLAIVVSATEGMKAPDEGNLSTVVLKDIALYLAPDHPMK